METGGAVQKIGRGEVTQAELVDALTHIQNQNPYASEHTTPRFFYPEGYKPNLVEEQVRLLLELMPDLDASHVEAISKSWQTPDEADGIYVIRKPSVVAVRRGVENPWNDFGTLAEKGPLADIAAQRRFTNYRAGQLGPDRYRATNSAKDPLRALEAEQPGDFLVFPASTGRLFAGYSPRNSRWEVEHSESRFPMLLYVGGEILLGNPHRFTRNKDLALDCPGDEYRFGDSAEFGDVLCFSFRDGRLACGRRPADDPRDRCGSGFGFSR